jgi:hypothetical protein
MAQRYKLRLGDGTVLAVDAGGLKTWAADGAAMVQAVGSWRWQPLREVLAEEEAAARLARALVPPTQRPEATPPPPAPQSRPVELPRFSEPPVAVASRPSLQVLADDPVSAGSPRSEPAPASDVAVPVIRMKPLDDEPVTPEFRSAWSESQDEDEGALDEDEPRQGLLDGPLLTVLETFGGFLSRCLDPLAPLAARLTSRQPEAPRPPRVEGPTLYARASEFVRGLTARFERGVTARLERGARPERPEPPAPRREPAPPVPQMLPPRQPLAAPPPLSELPTLRFVETREPPEPVDVYEGEEPSFSLQPVWLWTKRVVVIGALAAGVAYAVLEWDTWFPKAADLGQTVFTEIDRQARSGERTEQQQQALAAATARLPHLAPETIQLIFDRSPAGIPEPGDIFQVAREAADRGQAALSPAEAEELAALQAELLATLRPTERARIREYDQARSRRVIFSFENAPVMDVVAQGTRALPAPRRERLRALSHRAIAAGLDAALGPPAASPAAAAAR